MSAPPYLTAMADDIAPIVAKILQDKKLIPSPSLSNDAVNAKFQAYIASNAFKTMAREQLLASFDGLVDGLFVEEVNVDLSSAGYPIEYRRDPVSRKLTLCDKTSGTPVLDSNVASNSIPSSKRVRTSDRPGLILGPSSGNAFAPFGGNPFAITAPAPAANPFAPSFRFGSTSVPAPNPATVAVETPKSRPFQGFAKPTFNPVSPTPGQGKSKSKTEDSDEEPEFAETSDQVPTGSAGNLARTYFGHLKTQYDHYINNYCTEHNHQVFIMCQAYSVIRTFGRAKGNVPNLIRSLLMHYFATNDFKFRKQRLLEIEADQIRAFKYIKHDPKIIFNMQPFDDKKK